MTMSMERMEVHAGQAATATAAAAAGEDEGETIDVPLIVYEPEVEGSARPLPVLVWYHGGGFCIGSIEDQMYRNICRRLANMAACIVVAVEYRLAPEWKFPTQIEDAYTALLWIHEHSGKEGPLENADPTRIAVGGDSAGGSLTAAMCVLCLDRGGPKLKHQLLIYPCLTNPLNDDIPSHRTYRNGPVLRREVMWWFMTQLFVDLYVPLPQRLPCRPLLCSLVT
eukprot:TRINITY_DN6259_c1_g1_i2.p1 TRINITY_DN6259_c1_g1~~TRINITY_DN6259_c1_g1_i2.p1  ORF type:complete len:243 (+),score=76.12 TRINITY_DN6259_c1_g1_i2:60-731(+)